LIRKTAHLRYWYSLVLVCAPFASKADDWISVHGALEDIKLYYTAPLRWDEGDWVAFAGTLAVVAASHAFDERVRTHFASPSDALNGGQDPNSLRDAAPTLAIIGGTFLYAGFLRDHDGYRETWAMIEAGVFSTATAELMSRAIGRERPDATASANEWRQGGDSFPSVHVTAAFAVGTVLAEGGNDKYRWLRRILGYGIAVGTAYERLHENAHWLSDTVAGSALGIATARFSLNREGATNGNTSWQFEPTKNGWMLVYAKRF
jgi:membrane-associated phospholipid phosphatase